MPSLGGWGSLAAARRGAAAGPRWRPRRARVSHLPASALPGGLWEAQAALGVQWREVAIRAVTRWAAGAGGGAAPPPRPPSLPLPLLRLSPLPLHPTRCPLCAAASWRSCLPCPSPSVHAGGTLSVRAAGAAPAVGGARGACGAAGWRRWTRACAWRCSVSLTASSSHCVRRRIGWLGSRSAGVAKLGLSPLGAGFQ